VYLSPLCLLFCRLEGQVFIPNVLYSICSPGNIHCKTIKKISNGHLKHNILLGMNSAQLYKMYTYRNYFSLYSSHATQRTTWQDPRRAGFSLNPVVSMGTSTPPQVSPNVSMQNVAGQSLFLLSAWTLEVSRYFCYLLQCYTSVAISVICLNIGGQSLFLLSATMLHVSRYFCYL